MKQYSETYTYLNLQNYKCCKRRKQNNLQKKNNFFIYKSKRKSASLTPVFTPFFNSSKLVVITKNFINQVKYKINLR